MTDLTDVSPGDKVTSARQNLINDYIQDGSHKTNTLSLDIGGTEVISSARAAHNITTLNLPNGVSDPESGTEGDIFYNTTSNTLKTYNGAAWNVISGSVITRADVIAYDDIVAGEATVFALPTGSNILSCHMAVGTAFDSGATMEIGISSDHDKFITSQDVSSIGIKNANYTLGSFLLSTAAATDIVAYCATAIEAWSVGGNLATARTSCSAFGNSQSDSVVTGGSDTINTTEEYDGASWSAGGNLIAGRRAGAAGGASSSAGWIAGGNTGSITNTTEEYNGSAWSSGGNTNKVTEQWNGGCVGTQTAGLVWGGYSSGVENRTEEYDGANWAYGGNLSETVKNCGNSGVQTDALRSAGEGGTTGSFSTRAEEYDGASWTTGGSLSAGRHYNASSGVTTTASITFGGTLTGPIITGTSEKYNGTSWSSGPTLNTARQFLGGSSVSSAALSMGGSTGTDSDVTEEYSSGGVLTQGEMTIRTVYATY